MYNVITTGKWQTLVSEKEMPLTRAHVSQIEQTLSQWEKAFTPEPTWVWQNLGVPSLFVRADCVINGDKVSFYEVEERPAGMGLLLRFVPGLEQSLAELRREWPEFGFVASQLRGETEDRFWLKQANGHGLVVVRAEPTEEQFASYQSRSVSTVLTKGDKSYGVQMGWWNEVNENDVLPYETGFVLKPKQGSKCRNICFHAPLRRLAKGEARTGIDKLLKQSNSTVNQIEASLSDGKTMYCQPYIAPMSSGISDFEFMIYRLMFGYSPVRQSWHYLGGCWNARNSLRIHGASDTLFGPVRFFE